MTHFILSLFLVFLAHVLFNGPLHLGPQSLIMIKWHHFSLLSLCLIGGCGQFMNLSFSDIIIWQIFLNKTLIFIIERMMASAFALQLVRIRKPAVSISLASPSMMSLVDGFQNCPQHSCETQTEWEKMLPFY